MFNKKIITIDTIIKQQVSIYNGKVTNYEEFKGRLINENYLYAYVIDENQNRIIVVIPYCGTKPFVLEYDKVKK